MKWVYIGERPGKDVKRVAVWRTESGDCLAWKSTVNTRGVVGYMYSVENFDGTTWPKPQWTGEASNDLTNLRLEDDAQKREFGRDAAIRKAAQRSELADLDSAVREAAKGLSYDAKGALVHRIQKIIWES